MINEKIKQALLNGAYGISRNGRKCKFVDTRDNPNFPHIFVYYDEDGSVTDIFNLTDQFTYYLNKENDPDVIGLWKDIPEPFNLEKALQGEPVMTREGNKAYIKYCLSEEDKNDFPLGGYIINSIISRTYHYSWSLTGKAVEIECNHPQDIVSMWKESEPESNTVTVTLPCPLKEPKDEMWFINLNSVRKSGYTSSSITPDQFEQVTYFGSKADAQAWLDAMRDNRR